MKPLRLHLQAFGPYSDTAEIDFRDLSLGGLFLIHGQTGAGKTSILDGLCFALFGKSSGSERSPEALRCDLAKSDLATEATLEFSLGLEIYKIVRRPRQQLKKKRGDGLTISLPKGDLFRMAAPATALEDAAWTLITSGDKKTDEKITELLGMTEEQFRQIVVLPQGQFRKFLSASSDDREALLEKLFRTSHYRRLAEHLQRQAAQLEAEIQAQRRDLHVQLAMANCETYEALEEQTKELEFTRSAFAKDHKAFQSRYREATQRRDFAQLANQLTKDFTSCEERKHAIEGRRAARDRADAKLENEKRARPILAFDDHVLSLDRELRDLNSKIEIETKTLHSAIQSLEHCQAAQALLLKRADEVEALREKHRYLQSVYIQVQRLEQALKLQSETQKSKLLVQAHRESARGSLATLITQQKQLRTDYERIQEKVKALPGLRTEMTAAENEVVRRREILKDIEERTSKLRSLTSRIQTDENRLLSLQEELKKKKVTFHLSQAALLAKTLKHQEPCPVCGNTDHPQPAEDLGASVTPEEIEDAEAVYRKHSTELATLRSHLETTQGETAKSLARAHVGSVDALKSAVETEMQSLEERKNQLQKLEAEDALSRQAKRDLEVCDASVLRAEANLKKADAELSQAQIRDAECTARYEQLNTEVPPEWRDLAAITREGQVLKATITAYEKEKTDNETQLSLATRSEAAAQASLKVLRGDVIAKLSQRSQNLANRDHALKVSGLPSIEDARAGAMSFEQVQIEETLRRAFDEDVAGLKARLEDLEEKKRTLPEWAFQVDQIEAEFAALEVERAQRDKSHADLESKLASFIKLKAQVSTVNETIQTLSKRFSTLGKLAGVAMGQPPFNLSRVNFPRYILATRLDEVLEQASRRLFLMSRGQFSLRRAQTAGDKRKNAGLDLEVEDSFTGTRRPTASLSGGEGFLASLSLALGVADVVQSRLGGVRLEAVFVDEGFGTLDGEALEQAIKTLSELQAGGRLVGIISHVPELKDQIARRLFVQKSAVGSRVGWDNAIL